MIKPLILVGGGGHCKSVIDVAESAGYTILSIFDRPEEVSKKVLGYEIIGTVVMHQAVVNADAKIGEGCIINTFANIEHDVVIGDYCHISTGAMVNGGSTVAYGPFVGSQSAINQCVKIEQGGGLIISS